MNDQQLLKEAAPAGGPRAFLYRELLRGELETRCRRNRNYSLRAFARALDVDPGALSRILSGKQRLSPKLAKHLADRLDLSPLERERFVQSAVEERSHHALSRVLPASTPSGDVGEIDAEGFRVISELHHYAILELTRTGNFHPSIQNIARRLGIPPLKARAAVERLRRLGLLEEKDGGLRKTNCLLTVKNKEVTTPALKKQQKEILARALDAMDLPIERRVANSLTVPIDPAQLPVARELITEFCRSLSEVLERGNRTQVYQLHINLFPLERQSL